MASTATAEPVLNRRLSSVTIRTDGPCSVIDIDFNRPVTVGAVFPPEEGSEVAIAVSIGGTTQTPGAEKPVAEQASVNPGNGAGLVAVTYDPAMRLPGLVLRFSAPMRYRLGRAAAANRVTLTVTAPNIARPCPEGPARADAHDDLALGKASLAARNYDQAVAHFTRAAAGTTGARRQQAREFLGLAREKAGQLPHARRVYEDYLKDYPQGPDALRVRQRLDGVLAALRSDAEAALAQRRKTKLEATGPATGKPAPPAGIRLAQPAPPAAPAWVWEVIGSAGQTYYRDDSFAGTGFPLGTVDDHDLARNDVISHVDVTVRGGDGESELSARLSAAQTTAFAGDNDGEEAVSAAYVDMRNRLNGLSARLGRQYRSGGGVFGRFDGALMGFQASERLLFQAVAGSPVYYGDSEPFADGRYFAGASIDLTSPDKAWSGALYAIAQNVEDTIDRRAIGAELRYAAGDVSAYGGLDVDVFYGEVNAAFMSGSWNATERLVLSGGLDYRHVPFLLTSNALMGQPVDSLSELVDRLGMSETEALAVDRTATALTGTLGLAYQLSPNWQASLEAAIAQYSGTPASGGVDAIPDPGVEVYLTAWVNGTGLFKEGDYGGMSLTWIDGDSYRSAIADLLVRYPLSENWRLAPRLRLAYRESEDSGFAQWLVMPALGFSYRVSRHWVFEGEAAVLWEHDRGTTGGSDDSADLRLVAGYRYEF